MGGRDNRLVVAPGGLVMVAMAEMRTLAPFARDADARRDARRAEAPCRWQGARAASAKAQAAADPGGAASATEGGADGDARWGADVAARRPLGPPGGPMRHPPPAAGRWPGGWRRRESVRRPAAFRALRSVAQNAVARRDARGAQGRSAGGGACAASAQARAAADPGGAARATEGGGVRPGGAEGGARWGAAQGATRHACRRAMARRLGASRGSAPTADRLARLVTACVAFRRRGSTVSGSRGRCDSARCRSGGGCGGSGRRPAPARCRTGRRRRATPPAETPRRARASPPAPSSRARRPA